MTLTLLGRKILVTRESTQAKQFADLIKKANGVPIEIPLLQIRCCEKEDNLDISKYQWIFFTSAHGVSCFFNQYMVKENELSNCRFATVGHKTEKALKKFGYEAAFIPSTYNAEIMAEEFFKKYPNANDILLVRGNLSRQLLVDELTERKLSFSTCVVYETAYYLEMKDELLQVFQEEDIDLLTFTSPSTVQAFMEIMKQQANIQKVLQIPCVCIGTTTEKTAKRFKFTTTIVPDTFTIESMVESMINFIHMEGLR